MTFLTQHDVYELIVGYICEGQFCCNVLHFANNDTTGPSSTPADDALELIDGFTTSVQSVLMGVLADDVILVGYKAKRVNHTGGPAVVQPTNVSGGVAGGTMVSGIGPCLTFDYYDDLSTSDRGPAWRAGRIFLPGIPADKYELNEPIAGYLTDLTNLLSTIRTVFVSAGAIHWQFVIWSRTQNAYSVTSTGTVSLKPGTQRRRMMPTI